MNGSVFGPLHVVVSPTGDERCCLLQVPFRGLLSVNCSPHARLVSVAPAQMVGPSCLFIRECLFGSGVRRHHHKDGRFSSEFAHLSDILMKDTRRAAPVNRTIGPRSKLKGVLLDNFFFLLQGCI
jgi:hypothetical protein